MAFGWSFGGKARLAGQHWSSWTFPVFSPVEIVYRKNLRRLEHGFRTVSARIPCMSPEGLPG